jgi:acyl-CoA synthetase (AMP-forming)/AMP-acid ligase II
VHAAVVTRDKQVLSIEEIVAYCRGKIAGYKIPKSVTCSTELLPMTGSGKVSKRQIWDIFWQGQTTKI